MPRITDERRAANRTAIVDAARRCFARDGFHQSSMPDLVAEAGISAGAFYRYFDSKEAVVREIAREAFVGLGRVVAERLGAHAPPSVAEVVTLLVEVLGGPTLTIGERTVDLDVQFRVAVQAWGEILRNESLRDEAAAGIERVVAALAEAFARGRAAGRVPADLDPEDGARLVVTLLPGLILQRAAFGRDPAAVGRAVAVLLGG